MEKIQSGDLNLTFQTFSIKARKLILIFKTFHLLLNILLVIIKNIQNHLKIHFEYYTSKIGYKTYVNNMVFFIQVWTFKYLAPIQSSFLGYINLNNMF